MDVWSITHRGAVREQNQDACRYHLMGDGDSVLALVCDGMGGARSGDIASNMAVETFFEEFFSGLGIQEETIQRRLERAAALANSRVFYKAQNDLNCTGMGTTLVAVWTDRQQAYLINEGDSRAYHLTQGDIRQITRDHSLVEDLIAQGGITREESHNYPLRNVITRALGAELDLRTDFFVESISPGDFLLLCSDGLSNVVTNQEIAEQVYHGGPPEECCKRLLELSLERGAPDNVTAILITC